MNKVTRNIAALIAIGSTSIGFAQVTQQKIGSNPTMINQSAVLEVESADKGILAPRVTLTSITDAVTIATPSNALTVFNTATAGTAPNDVTPGYYYWSSAENKWVRLIDKLPQSVNIYNADGSISGSETRRTLTLNGKELTFNGDEQQTYWSADGSMNQSGSNGRASLSMYGGNDSNLFIQQFENSNAQISAGGNSTSLYLGTSNTNVSAPITFSTSAGGGANGTEKMRITGTGDVGIDTDTPSEKFDVGSGNVRVRDINANIGVATDRVVVSDADGILKTIPASTFAATNIYNANGTLTSNRTLTLGGFALNFTGTEQTVALNSLGWLQLNGQGANSSFMRMSTIDGNANGVRSNFDMQLFPDNMMQMYATDEVTKLTIATHETLNSAPIEFATSPGTSAPGEVRMIITGTGEVGIGTTNPTEKLDVGSGNVRIRDINGLAGNIATDKVVMASNTGVLRTAAVADLNNNIYTNNGTLAGARLVNMNSNNLTFQTAGNGSILFNTGTSGVGSQNINGTNRGNITLNGGSATVDLFVDDAAPAQLTIRGNATSMNIGTSTGQLKPLNFVTNGTIKATVTATGEMAIGATTAPSFIVGGTTIQPKLYVAGDISTTGKYYTTNSVYADYVFEKYFKGNSDINPDYEFKSLDYVKEFIEEKHHLPGVESINNLSKTENGYTFDMTKLTVQSLEKIEELYLHTIELKEKLDVQYQIGEQQEKMIQSQQKELEELKNRFSRLEELLIKQ